MCSHSRLGSIRACGRTASSIWWFQLGTWSCLNAKGFGCIFGINNFLLGITEDENILYGPAKTPSEPPAGAPSEPPAEARAGATPVDTTVP